MKLGRLLRVALLFLAVALPAVGVETAFWQVGSFDEFLQGTLTRLSLSKEGDLTLAPDSQAIFSPDEALSLSLAHDSHGNLYMGTGHQGKVFRVSPDGNSKLVLTASEPDIFAMAVGPDGNLYVGSTPDGKVYKVTPDGNSSVFYDPKAKYIWALEFDAQGRLYVATGDKGQILRVDQNGKGELFFDTKQTHVMCLRFDAAGNLLAGSVPNGLLYRITPQGKAFAIYQSTLPEIHDLAVDSRGNIFAATLGGAGTKGSSDLLLAPPAGGGAGAVTTVTVTASTDPESAAKGQAPSIESKNPSFNRATPQTPPAFQLQLGTGRGALVEIYPDLSAETIWSSQSESIFGLAIRNDHALFTTDSNGRIFDINPRPDGGRLTLLTETHEALATRLLTSGTDLYVATSNAARLFRVGSSPAHEGTYESVVKDTKFVSKWGVLAWRGDVPPGCKIEIYTRSGNSDHPDETWSDWAGPYSNPNDDAITNPPARYMQWKAVLHSAGNATPTLDEVTLSLLNQNLPPQIHSLNVSTSSERTGAAGGGLNLPLGGGLSVNTTASVGYGLTPQTGASGKVPITLTWQADDPNNDQLVFALYVKATDERDWHLLKDKLHQSNYSIDPSSLTDGKYVARLVASDEESNPSQLARKSELLSAPFWVDNTPPDVEVVKQAVNGSAATVQFSAEDTTSPLHSAEYSVDGNDWRDILSDDGVVDSRKETFTVNLPHLAPGEHILTLRASDTSGNIGVGKAILQVSGSGRP